MILVRTMEKKDEKRATSDEGELKHTRRKLSPFGHLFRFFGWWFGFTGLYAAFAVCPFCGQQGCPVGLASAGTVGAFFALCLQDWKLFLGFLKQKLAKNKDKMGSNNATHSAGNSAALHSRRRWLR